jgi:uncharacterized membrane protein
MEQGLALAAGLAAALLGCAAAGVVVTPVGPARDRLLGLAASAYLFSRKLDATGGPSWCNVNAVVNCDVVNSSAASEVMGIPIALLGAGFFLGVAVAARFVGAPRQRLFQVVAWLAGAGVLYSVFLAVTATQLGAICLFCMTIYGCCALLVWGGGLGARREGAGLADAPGQVASSAPALVVLFVFLGVVLVGQSAWSSAGRGPRPVGRSRRSRRRAGRAPSGAGPADRGHPVAALRPTRHPCRSEGDEPRLGARTRRTRSSSSPTSGARIAPRRASCSTISCRRSPRSRCGSACSRCRACATPVLPESTGPSSRSGGAAPLSRPVRREPGQVLGVRRRGVRGQPDLSDERLVDIAKSVGLDMAKLQTCMADPATLTGGHRRRPGRRRAPAPRNPASSWSGSLPDRPWRCAAARRVCSRCSRPRRGDRAAPVSQASCPM